jgi:hypothetical protein
MRHRASHVSVSGLLAIMRTHDRIKQAPASRQTRNPATIAKRPLPGRMGATMRIYLQITGLIFGVVTLGHALRLIMHWPVQLAGWMVPMWLSWVAIVIAGSLCIWAFSLTGRAPR